MSVKASSHEHDEHELVFSARGHNDSVAADLATGVGKDPAHCENVRGEVLAAWASQQAEWAAIWKPPPGSGHFHIPAPAVRENVAGAL